MIVDRRIYLDAWKDVLNQLKWDLNPLSRHSRRLMRRIKDGIETEKAVILCNGPSLLKVDFGLLKGVYTFGLNKINLLFDKVDFRPSCIVSVNPYVIEQNAEFFASTGIPLFVDSHHRKLLGCRRGNIAYMRRLRHPAFSVRPDLCFYQGYTVTYVALQIAYFFGFRKVALVGCDHSFEYQGSPNETRKSGGRDPNHFDPNYFSGGAKWQNPDLLQSEISYRKAREVFESACRSLVNATEGGNLEILERMQLEDFVRE